MAQVSAQLRNFVAARAMESCEYCLIHAAYTAFAHEVDHVIARKHGGATEPDNLAFACAQCNRFKGSDIAAPDPVSGDIVPLYNPRTMNWGGPLSLGWAAHHSSYCLRPSDGTLAPTQPDRSPVAAQGAAGQRALSILCRRTRTLERDAMTPCARSGNTSSGSGDRPVQLQGKAIVCYNQCRQAVLENTDDTGAYHRRG